MSRPGRLPAWSGFAAVLSAAGLPIYIYAPKYYADTFGVSLTLLGVVLFGLRCLDFVQDPLLGALAERIERRRGLWIAGGAAVMAVSMLGLFAVTPPFAPVWWFALTTTGLFTAFSFLTISFYGQGVAKAGQVPGGHVRLAAWRESGALTGVCVAAVAPTALMGVVAEPFAVFAWGFAACVLVATLGMAPEWTARASSAPTPLRAIWGDALARRLLMLALVNAMPLAVSSTLFLFFVESRLAAPGFEGPLLVLFFLAAAVSAPAWSAVAQRRGVRPTLIIAMVTAILSFGITLTLGPGDTTAFAVICVVSGAAIGADLTLMPALFARRMEEVAPKGGQGFGLWSLVNKLTLAIAAAVLLPALDVAGFESGGENAAAALSVLTLLYGGLPIVLKLGAIAMLLRLTLPEGGAVSRA
ncbi:MFS transporter [Histidinibacterium lentulum]|uniref:Sugar:cation symporter n=1 Tax=Histidinibacterium lentulum TaxID=2480588 RepID=A0A3N2R604_9RHOB|nr:MFS transporter [Histidinibacterium lentulum]ROU02833.1 sugar:cation symporter [Histidinibacterium lentulum]